MATPDTTLCGAPKRVHSLWNFEYLLIYNKQISRSQAELRLGIKIVPLSNPSSAGSALLVKRGQTSSGVLPTFAAVRKYIYLVSPSTKPGFYDTLYMQDDKHSRQCSNNKIRNTYTQNSPVYSSRFITPVFFSYRQGIRNCRWASMNRVLPLQATDSPWKNSVQKDLVLQPRQVLL